MDPLTAILATVAALSTLWAARQQYKNRAMEVSTDMATLVDKRIQAELSRLDDEIKNLKDRVRHLEGVEAEYDTAVMYMRLKGLPWPPPVSAL